MWTGDDRVQHRRTKRKVVAAFFAGTFQQFFVVRHATLDRLSLIIAIINREGISRLPFIPLDVIGGQKVARNLHSHCGKLLVFEESNLRQFVETAGWMPASDKL